MPRLTFRDEGAWNAVCDQCGRGFKNYNLYKEWDGLRVCAECLDPRHPQELQRPMPDPRPAAWTRPRGFIFENPDPQIPVRQIDAYVLNSITLG